MGYLEYSRQPHDGPRAELRRLLTWENDDGRGRVIADAFANFNRTYYAAVEHIRPDGERVVWAAVFIGNFTGKGAFGYKDMDETCGPNESECPARILDLLTPTTSEWALSWRQRCRDNLAAKKAKTLRDGARVILVDGVTYGGHSVFTARKTPHGWRFQIGDSGPAYKLPGITSCIASVA